MRMLLSAGSMPRASNGQTRIPLVGTRVPRARDDVPCAAYLRKGILVWLQRVFPSGLPPRGGGLGGPRSHARVPPCRSKLASKQRAGRHTRRDSSLGFGACGEPPGRPPVRVLNIRLPTIPDALPVRPRPSRGSPDGCYLVDPASSHMLVSKIKPCMCKYELIQTVKLRMAH